MKAGLRHINGAESGLQNCLGLVKTGDENPRERRSPGHSCMPCGIVAEILKKGCGRADCGRLARR